MFTNSSFNLTLIISIAITSIVSLQLSIHNDQNILLRLYPVILSSAVVIVFFSYFSFLSLFFFLIISGPFQSFPLRLLSNYSVKTFPISCNDHHYYRHHFPFPGIPFYPSRQLSFLFIYLSLSTLIFFHY